MTDPLPDSHGPYNPPDPSQPHRTSSASSHLLRTQPTLSRTSTARLLQALGRQPTPDTRAILLNDPSANAAAKHISNELRTSKYNWINLIPKALFEQFRRVANFYFLIVAVVSFVPKVSPTTPITNILPLFIVVGFGFARDVYEDVLRAKADRRTNGKKVIVLKRTLKEGEKDKWCKDVDGDMKEMIAEDIGGDVHVHSVTTSMRVQVGDVVLVRKGEEFPADMVLLLSSGDGGVAYVSTANLDGESNLKRVLVPGGGTNGGAGGSSGSGNDEGLFGSVEDLLKAKGSVRAAKPAPALHIFEGSMDVNGEQMALDSGNLLLRGSILRNTDFIYGLVVYTGYDTKVALNMRNPPSKLSSVEKKLNFVVIFLFLVLALFVIAGSIWSGILQGRDGEGQWYMGSLRNDSGTKIGLRGLGTFLVLFSTIIPISLFVTLEFVRVVQALFMEWDTRMRSKGKSMTARATNLNEMLGTIEHVLSDKTGTLTENVMRYVACTANGKIHDIRKDPQAMTGNASESVRKLVTAMALCHSVVPEVQQKGRGEEEEEGIGKNGKKKRRSGRQRKKRKSKESLESKNSNEVNTETNNNEEMHEREYQGQSPDEVALVSSAREFGVELLQRSLNSLTINRLGNKETYEMLGELEFNSDRKRMSMILREPDKRIRIITKGADTVMIPLLRKDSIENTHLEEHVDQFAVEGLRTLVFAQKIISEDDFLEWNNRFQAARNSLENREELVGEVSAELEKDLDYIAATAVEDRLQDQCPETIQFLRDAGVRLWVLTGDKRETAENIGYSANLLDRKMNIVQIKAVTAEQCEHQLTDALMNYARGKQVPKGMSRSKSSKKSFSRSSTGTDGGGGRESFLYRLSSAITRRVSRADETELAVIVDGASLALAIEHHQDLFVELTDFCKTVICCRVTPMQKAQVVGMVRDVTKATTLAVGDGGNDVSMIQEAHVGVGMYGKEGTQAARAADYAIAEFKHLKRLITVHGRYNYVRTAGVINLSFYKNIVFTMMQVYFQPFAFVTGPTFHNQWYTQIFNVVITALNPFLYGIFERDLDEEQLNTYPRIYKSNRGNALFSLRSVLEYAGAYGIWHSVCIFFGLYLAFGYLRIPFTDGKDGGFFLTGLAATSIVVVVALFKFMLHTHLYNIIIIVAFIISFAMFFVAHPIIVNLLDEFPLEGTLKMLFKSPSFWLSVLVIVTACFLLDFSVLMIRKLIFPTGVTILQERDAEKKKR